MYSQKKLTNRELSKIETNYYNKKTTDKCLPRTPTIRKIIANSKKVKLIFNFLICLKSGMNDRGPSRSQVNKKIYSLLFRLEYVEY